MPDLAAGVIHDLGYQRYEGPRLGRWYAARSLYVHGVRTAFGLGRSAKAKVFPWITVGLIGLIAAVLTAVRSDTPIVTYVEFPEMSSILLLLFGAMVAPELVSRDLRSGVLSLYFSRPLRPSDYALAKLAALVTALFLPVAGALVLMFLGGAFTSETVGQVWDEFVDLLPALAYTGGYAVTLGTISLLIASLSGRRAVAAACVVAAFLVTTPVVGVLHAGGETAGQLAGLASPMTLLGGVGDWLFKSGDQSEIGPYGPVYGVVTLALNAACGLLLLARYRKVK